MKKKGIIGLVLAGLLLVSGMILAGCAEFDAFMDGYDYGKNNLRSYDPGSIFDRDAGLVR